MGVGEITDEQLIARTVRGDVAAFELIYDRYAPTVMGLALRVVADRALAEEVVQETFWRVWRNAASFQGQRGAFAGWLLGITRNLRIDFCRRRSVRPQVLLDDADESPIERMPDQSADVAESAWTAIKYQQVYAALSDFRPNSGA